MNTPLFFRGLGEQGAHDAPVILARTEDDFVEALLTELSGDAAIERVRQSRTLTRDGSGILRLLQPVHRTFHVAVMEIGCDAALEPRLDPTRIDSAGLVVRRVSRIQGPRNGDRQGYPYAQGWLSDGATRRGWSSFDSPESAAADPDPRRRPQPKAGPPEVTMLLQSLLAAGSPPQAESTAPLFVAPPDACARVGRTVLFGMIPTASMESVESPAGSGDHAFTAADIKGLIPALLRSSDNLSMGDIAGVHLTYALASAREKKEAHQGRSEWHLKNFLTMLRQLVTQFRAFDETESGRALVETLNRVPLPFSSAPTSRPAGDYLKAAALVLVLEPDLESAEQVELPSFWPAFPEDIIRELTRRFARAAEEQFATMAPRTLRFDDHSAQYHVRAFARIKRPGGCPPLVIWSNPSEPFTIAPWYENGGRPPALIQLPNLTRKNVKLLRPNVALKLPRRLFNFLSENDPKDLLDGKGREGSDVGLDHICSFNIPIITLCAFIALFIFLSLLNVVFWWMPFVRICFPIPSIKKEGT